MNNNVGYGTRPANKYVMRMEKSLIRYIVSLAYNRASEAGIPPERELGYAVPIYNIGPSLTGSFVGWYREAAVIDVTHLNRPIAVGWLLRSRRQVSLVNFYSVASTILELPFGEETKLLGQTRKNLDRDVFDHLQQSRHGVAPE